MPTALTAGELWRSAILGAVALLTVAIVLRAGATASAEETPCAPRQSAYSGAIAATPGLVGY